MAQLKKPTRTPAKAKQPRVPGNGFNKPNPAAPKPGTIAPKPGTKGKIPAPAGPPGAPGAPPVDPMTGMPVPAPMPPPPPPGALLAEPPPAGLKDRPVVVPKNAFVQMGSHGLNQWGGLIYEDIINELNGKRGFRAYRELSENSAVAGACLLAIETLIRKVPWHVEAGEPTDVEKYRAEAVESMLHDMSTTWADTVTEILTMLVFGFSYLETVYKIRRGPDEKDGKYRSRYEDGLIGWRKWVHIPQETLDSWEFDEDGGIAAMLQRAPSDFGTLRRVPITKALLFRTKTTKNNPQGKSLLRSAYFPWHWVKRIMEAEGIGIERDLTGLPIARVPPEILDPNAPAADKTQLEYIKKVVTQVRQNELAGVIFPLAYDDKGKELYDFELMTTGGMKQFDTGKVVERYERRIAMSMLADFVMMGHEKVGSLQLSKDKVTLVGRLIASLVDGIASIINQHALPRLYAANGWKTTMRCKLIPGDLETADIKNMGVYVRNLMSVGALTPDPILEKALREFAGLPPQDPEFNAGPEEMTDVPPEDQPDDADEELPVPVTIVDPDEDEDEPSSKPDLGRKVKPSSKPDEAAPVYPGLPRKLRPARRKAA